jgi:hypothetical protein
LDEQQQHWEDSFGQKPEMFGAQPSTPALPIIEKWPVNVAGFGVVPLPSAATTEMLF